MPTVNKCDILWTVVKSQQTITMKVCIEPQLLIMASNISDLNMSSLQNYSYTLQNTTSLNISTNISNISIPVTSNISNTSLNTYTPSPSVIDDTPVAPSSLMSSIPIDDIRVAPSSMSSIDDTPVAPSSLSSIDDIQVAPSSMSLTSNFIRGSTMGNSITPSPQVNLTRLSPSSAVNNTTGYIFIIFLCLVLIVVLVACFLRIRHKKYLKIPFNKGKLKNTKDRKYIKGKIYTSTVTPNHLIKRPKDFVIEYLVKGEQKTQRQVPRPPKEETEDHDINDKPPSE
jgi:hypothetical protein